MQTHTDVETILTAGLHHVLVSTDTGSLQSYTGGEGGGIKLTLVPQLQLQDISSISELVLFIFMHYLHIYEFTVSADRKKTP